MKKLLATITLVGVIFLGIVIYQYSSFVYTPEIPETHFCEYYINHGFSGSFRMFDESEPEKRTAVQTFKRKCKEWILEKTRAIRFRIVDFIAPDIHDNCEW